MKVLDLQCAQLHGFEGWFGSEEDYASQLARGLVACPMCGDNSITKKLSAPRLNLGHTSAPAESSEEPRQQVVATTDPQTALQAAWLGMARRILANTEDVGERFAEEARRIHYGETEHRGIRGQASRSETEALADEGIEVMQLALPDLLKGPLQ
ncbi:MAG: DUF1178 family protein [Rhodoferax sp.]|nr:DUF1178 family protein [Rhodoferax sp.]